MVGLDSLPPETLEVGCDGGGRRLSPRADVDKYLTARQPGGKLSNLTARGSGGKVWQGFAVHAFCNKICKRPGGRFTLPLGLMAVGCLTLPPGALAVGSCVL